MDKSIDYVLVVVIVVLLFASFFVLRFPITGLPGAQLGTEDLCDTVNAVDLNITSDGSCLSNVTLNGSLRISGESEVNFTNVTINVERIEIAEGSTAVFDDVTLISEGVSEISGNVIVRNSKSTVWQNDDLVITGNYTLDNSTLKLNGTVDGDVGINITGTGVMTISNNSLITNGDVTTAEFFFVVQTGAAFRMENSVLEEAGWADSWAQRGLEISANNAVISGSTINQSYIGVTLYSSSNTIANSNISGNNPLGIYITGGSGNTIENNTINDNRKSGACTFPCRWGGIAINGASDNNVIKGNTIFNSRKEGITFADGRNLTIQNNNISGTDAGPAIGIDYGTSQPSGIKIINATMITNAYDILISGDNSDPCRDGATDITLADSFLLNPGTNNLLVGCDGNIEIINSSFNTDNVSIVDGTISVEWYLDVNVKDSLNANVGSANATLYNKTNAVNFSMFTDSSGNIIRQNVTEYIQNQNGKTYLTPYTLNVTKPGFNIYKMSLNITTGTIINANITDNTTPTITLSSPANTTLASTNVTLQLSADETINRWWYELDGNANVTFTPNTTFTAAQGSHTLRIYANDSVNFVGSSQVAFSVDPDTTAPVVNLVSPGNKTGDGDGNVTFTYNATDASSGIINCSLYINGNVNQTNTSITEGTNQVFVLSNIGIGRYNWTVGCIDDSFSRNVFIVPNRTLIVLRKTKFTGTVLEEANITNIPNFVIENTTSGRINFTNATDLSAGFNLDTFINITYNRIEINDIGFPQLNKSAKLSFFNLPYQFTPLILKNNLICGSQCTPVSYSVGTLTFNVSGFSSYATSANSNLSVYDLSDGEGGNVVINPNQSMRFFANYSNKSSGVPISGSGVFCEIRFDIGFGYGSATNMTYNSSSTLYVHSSSFSEANSSYAWNVTCTGSSQGYEYISTNDTVPILDPCDIPSFADWNITQSCTKVSQGIKFTQNKKINILNGSSLTLNNVTLQFNMTADSNSAINVLSGGFLNVTNSSTLTSLNAAREWDFTISGSAILEHSTVQETTGITVNVPVSINNMTFSNMNEGISFASGTGRSNVTFSTITGNTVMTYGLKFSSANNFNISNNTITNIDGGPVRGNEYGIFFSNVDNSIVFGNSVTGVGGSSTDVQSWGILLSASDNNTIISNTFNSNQNNGGGLPQGAGIGLGSGSTNNTIANNTANSNGGSAPGNGAGIWISASSFNIIDSNTANSNTHHGIYLLSGSENNTITRNTANSNSNNDGEGIFLDVGSDLNSIAGNTMNSNKKAIYLTGNRNRAENNTANGNTADTSNEACSLDISGSNNIVINISLANNDNGVCFTGNNNIVKNASITGNRYGVVHEGSLNYLIDSVVSANTVDVGQDPFLNVATGNPNLTFINVTFNPSNMTYRADALAGLSFTLFVNWWVDVQANQSTGTSAKNMNITQFNRTGGTQQAKLTDAAGYVRFNVSEYKDKSDETFGFIRTYFNNITFNATGSAYNITGDNTQSINLSKTNNTAINFTLNAYTITVNLMTPTAGATLDEGNITFTYNVSSNATIDQCSLHYDTTALFNNAIHINDTSITKDTNKTFLVELLNGTWVWKVECYSVAISKNSTQRILTLNDVSVGGAASEATTSSSSSSTTGTGGPPGTSAGLSVSATGPVQATPNQELVLNIDVRNIGFSAIDNVIVSIGNCPAGWTCETVTVPSILDHAVTRVFLDVKVPLGTEPGTYRLNLVAQGGGYTATSSLAVVVKGFCSSDDECSGNEICRSGVCQPLFDIKILRIDSPIEPGEFLDFTYFVKNVAGDADDYTIEYELKDVASGSEVIFVDAREEKREISSLFVPTTTEPGIYDFIITLVRGTYAVPARTQIEVSQSAPTILEIELPKVVPDILHKKFLFDLELSVNKDRVVPLSLKERVTKDGPVIWQNERELNIIKFASIEEIVDNVGPGFYQLEITADYEGKTANLIRTFVIAEESVVTLPFIFGEFTVAQSIGGVPTVFILSVVLLVLLIIIMMLGYRIIKLHQKYAKVKTADQSTSKKHDNKD